MRRQKYKLYGGKCDIGGKASRAFSRTIKTIALATLIVLFEIMASFASNTEEPQMVMSAQEAPAEVSEEIVVPVTRVETPEPEIIPDEEVDDPNVPDADERGRYLGEFCITHYCTCSRCNGSNAGKTAIGYDPVPWNTVAVDPNLIPLGSTLYIEGYGYVNAIDTGSAVNGYHIDVLTNNHEEAIQHGVVYKEVYLV